MAIACPKCGRHSADTASACLYCGQEIEPREALPAGRRSNPHHIVWLPSGEADDDAARLEALLRTEPYRASMIVRGGGPRIIRTLGDPGAARELQERARRMGLRTFLADEHSLDTHPSVVAVDRVARGDGVLELGAGEASLRPAAEAIALLVTGRVPVHRQRSSSRISMLHAEPGATPGLPRVVKRTSITADHYGVLDLYPAGAETCWRVREESTDFSAVLPDGPASALLRFAALLDEIRAAAPAVPLDDRFDRFDDLDRTRAERRPGGPGVIILDGVARFGRHSRLAWMALRAD